MSNPRIDILRFRAEEFERNFYSLRTIEWQVYTLLFTGYTGIGAGFAFLRGQDFAKIINQRDLAMCTLAALFVVAVVGLYLLVRVQERVHFSREMHLEHVKAIHSLVPDSLLPKPATLADPKSKVIWCKVPMRAMAVFLWFLVSAGVWTATNWAG